MEYDQPSAHFPAGTLVLAIESPGHSVEFTMINGSEVGSRLYGRKLFGSKYMVPLGKVSGPEYPSTTPVMFHVNSKPKAQAAAAFWMTKMTGKGSMGA